MRIQAYRWRLRRWLLAGFDAPLSMILMQALQGDREVKFRYVAARRRCPAHDPASEL